MQASKVTGRPSSRTTLIRCTPQLSLSLTHKEDILIHSSSSTNSYSKILAKLIIIKNKLIKTLSVWFPRKSNKNRFNDLITRREQQNLLEIYTWISTFQISWNYEKKIQKLRFQFSRELKKHTDEIFAGNEVGVAVERGARRTRDIPSLYPESEELNDFSEQESSDGDEWNPEEGIEFSSGQVFH